MGEVFEEVGGVGFEEVAGLVAEAVEAAGEALEGVGVFAVVAGTAGE